MATTLAVVAAVALVVWAQFAIPAASPMVWPHASAMLGLLVAAGAARAVPGFPRGSRVRERRPGDEWRGAWAVLIAAAIVPYLHSLNVGFLSDDFALDATIRVLDDPLRLLGASRVAFFYRPVTALVWWSGQYLWAGSPIGYHTLNLALHTANTLLVFAVGKKLVGSSHGAMMAGVLFALHPIHVEPVVWACCQPDLICAAFGLLSLFLLEVYLAARPGRGAVALGGALLASMLAMLAKEAALALPGVVVLRLALLRPPDGRRRSLIVGGGYTAVLVAYLGVRFAVLGTFSGYSVELNFWNTVFPSAPLLQFSDFLFPINRALFEAALPRWALGAALAAMGAGALWWVGGLAQVPARRLWLWASYVFMMALPMWPLAAVHTNTLENSRFAYLPTVSLAWLFGDICARRGGGRRRSAAAAAAIVLGAGALCAWYVMPWRQAGRLARQVASAGAALVRHLPDSPEPPVLYVVGLPDTRLGAQVFRNGLDVALRREAGRPVSVHTVRQQQHAGRASPETLATRTLGPGEYVIAWRPESGRMEVVRAGDARHGREAEKAGPRM